MNVFLLLPRLSKTEAVTLRSHIMSGGLRPGWFGNMLGWFEIAWDYSGRVWFGMLVWECLELLGTVWNGVGKVWVSVWVCLGTWLGLCG